jgi:transcription termination factor Rho
MEFPSPSSEDKPEANTGTESADAPKKRPRTRSRLYRTSKGAKAGDSAAAAAPVSAPAPVEARSAPPPAPEPAPVRRDEPPASAPPASAIDTSAPAEAPAHEGGGDGRDEGGQYQQGGGGKFGRRFRDKHFRGGGGGGGGGGKWNKFQNGGPKHPPQPPPPRGEINYGDLPDPQRFMDLAALDGVADEIASKKEDPIHLDELYPLAHAELLAKAKGLGVKIEGVPNRKQLLSGIFAAAAEQKIPLLDRGWLDMTDRGNGFVVHSAVNYRLYPENAYVPEGFIRKYGLKRGHEVEVQVQPPQGNDRCPAVVRIRKVMGGAPEDIAKVKPFEELTPYYPLKRMWLEMPGQKDVSMRMVDIVTPVGFGQRGLIVAPPRTGKTILLQNMANSVAANSPEARLIILLVDERPEEVTDFRRHCKGEVVSSTFDETPESHVHCAEMVIEKARRLVERGEHIVILLDSITRLARAYNALASNSGKIMSGGLEATALQKPKRFFGSARNIEGAGSLTILGTALIDTGSRMDEIIFEEFKGTGNMELHLDRDLVNKRIFPALNIDKSGTRKEELIYHPDELARIYSLRRAMQGVPAADSMEMLITRLKKTKTNAEFLLSLNR